MSLCKLVRVFFSVCFFLNGFFQDGNLVMYDNKNNPIWHSGILKKGIPSYRLNLNDDGTLFIYDGLQEVIWKNNG